MAILPSRIQDLIDFFDIHAPVWSSNAAAIGLTPAQATAFSGLATAARNAHMTKLNADDAARAATISLQNAVADAKRSAADLIRSIKAYAESQSKPAVIYNLAQIPPPAAPAPAPAPAQPTDLSVSLVATTGALELRWKARNPAGTQGTSYIVRRREQGETEFTFVGVTGTKRFVDNTFLSGPDSVEYTVQGQRSDLAGPVSEILTINFGRTGPGLTIQSATSKSAGQAKMAA